MHILIIGAGIGGLSAALCFSRQQKQEHVVTVLESRPSLSPRGGGINIRPGASRVYHSWGLKSDLERISDVTSSFVLKSVETGEITMNHILIDGSEDVDWGTTREQLIRLLYEKTVETDAEILFGAEVADVVEEMGAEKVEVLLKDGRKLSADLILAADGIRSRIRGKILEGCGVDVEPVVSDVTLYGIRADGEKIRRRENTKRLVRSEFVDVWQGKDLFVVSRYSEKRQQFSGLFGIRSTNDMKGLWDENGNIQHVRDSFSGACEDLRAALDLADSCDRWKLAELPDLPRWISEGGRVALLGDSAHAMEPNAAQGLSMIIEDVGVLEYLINQHDTATATARIPAITKTWQDIRKPRVERIKAYAKENTRQFIGAPMLKKRVNRPGSSVKSLKNVEPQMNAPFATSAFVKWALDYDAVGEAKRYLEIMRPKL